MYAAVQHVTSQEDEAGVNAFLWDGDSAVSGILVKQELAVKPLGTNAVESYLDVKYDKGTERGQLEALLTSLMKAALQEGAPGKVSVAWPGTGEATFFVLPKHYESREAEFERLRATLLSLPLWA